MAKETMMQHLSRIDYEEDKLWYPERLEYYEKENSDLYLNINNSDVKEAMKIPKIKSKWRHSNGIKYKIIAIANETNTEKYPLTVVYKGKNGKIWSRPLSDWYRSFTEIIK